MMYKSVKMFAAALCVLLSGCSIRSATSGDVSAVSAESTENADIVASPSNGAEGMDIGREEYLAEYRYRLTRSGYGSDTDEQTLSAVQQEVVNDMIEDKLIRAKFAEYGLTLTDSDLEAIQDDVRTGIETMLSGIESAAAAADSSLSEDELEAQAQEQYRQILDTCGISEDTFRSWQETIYMRSRLTEEIGRDEECTDEELQSRLQALIAAAKSQYESSPEEYSGQNYAAIWIPDGSRTIQAILVSFDYDTYSQIISLRSDGSDEEADSLRRDSLSGLQERYEQIMSQIVAGADFGQLMEDFNEDEGNGTFLITPGTQVFGTEIEECAMGIADIGGTDTAVTDYGYYILRYKDDAVVTEETLNDTAEQLRSLILENKRSELFDTQLESWKTEYSYEINSELLGL